MFQDRRLFEREPVIVAIEPKEKLPGNLSVRDISKSGFKLETDQFMTVGEISISLSACPMVKILEAVRQGNMDN